MLKAKILSVVYLKFFAAKIQLPAQYRVVLPICGYLAFRQKALLVAIFIKIPIEQYPYESKADGECTPHGK